MPTNKSKSGDAKEATARFRAEPMHLVAQELVKPEDPDGEPRVLFRIPLGANERISVLGRAFPSMEEWTLRRARRGSDGRWVWDRSAGLQLDPDSVVRLRNGLIRGLQQMGSVAPSVSLAYLAERYEHGAEAGDANALVSHLVLRALALALGNGDGEALAAMGREALRHIRARRPEFVPVGDGEGALDLKGDEARRVGRDRLLRTASRFCDELGEDTDFAEAADELSWDIERLHPEAVRQAEIQEAKAPDFPNTGSGRGRIAEKLAEKLRCRSNPKPEWVARTALRMFGVDEAKVKHYFDHR
ncbi:MAG: hypothetical protein EPO40_27835 [Myxococcaceae bacterium]|jgi:hypothetical protein|nr:MAG: hypothetical protein EPO40_27835 [Myxococcaceae bacterium]